MKLNYSTSIVTFTYIYVIVIHICSTKCELSQEKRKVVIEQVKSNLLKVLGLKEVPKPKNKAYVPIEILQEYRKIRDSVRDTIPDDRDFYGKISLDDLDGSDDEFWSQVYHRYGNHAIEIDMSTDSIPSRKFFSHADIKQISSVRPESDPEDIDPKLEQMLPPQNVDRSKQKQFTSVHMKFNLSQDHFTEPYSVDEVRGAELHLAREKLTHENNSPTFSPSHQRIFILHVTGLDSTGAPIAHIMDSQRVDTQYSTPISFDITKMVKQWVKNPSKNYGIIIRVTNDDDDYEKVYPNASRSDNVPYEHFRLKRGFRSASDDDNSWIRHQPSILITIGSDEASRRHVKRDHSSSETSSRQTNSKQQNRNASPPSSRGTNQRSRGKQKPSRTIDKCGLKALSINFDDLGWSNWIIAPSSYYANFCMGDCSFPIADQQNTTNHAIIQAIFHSVGRNIPRTCCAPTKLGRMAILYQLDNSVQMKYYDDMIVESCGCL